MKFIVKLYPEITIKSKSVRLRFIKLLETNLRNVLKKVHEDVRVQKQWDSITVNLKHEDEQLREQLIDRLGCIPGIHSYLEVGEYSYESIDDIYQHAHAQFADSLAGKTFCVRVKRKGKHEFTSIEVERYVGGGLNQHSDAKGVSLKTPDVTVKLEIDRDKLFLVKGEFPGLGGFPIATQEDVLSLMSGGYDSGVASFQMIKKGCRTHYCFFNLGGAAHEVGVQQVAHYLWQKYGESHKVRFISVPFEPVVEEILERIDSGQMGVILKRMMMRTATKVAERFGIQALITGESLGQVSSQTLTNLNVIDRSTDTLILRPLAAMDKQDIINVARDIGTAPFAETMPEYCGVISKKPTVKAVLSKIEAEEEKFSEGLIERILEQSTIMDIREIGKAAETKAKILDAQTIEEADADAVVLDIRPPEEQEEAPLDMPGTEVRILPFYKLGSQFADLDQERTYLLYCDRGVMSKLQALYLQEQGFENVKVYRPG
ncbi:tRNA uracil 4-sulfurtransferase ThiI [Paraferrimonas sedimenticola]|uniref:tRNA sulfurtransferase n=1 Tax=Paraferrimonas sedimenticola TaxID=375674 RepID=A0AA37W1U2_9GAMM|nr:tRNA uracil 4-sulfurtransferase ThiI [Paraferrimonas sedimenticola]GLP96807.1 tRNA sulfurtransferase [Paraferrimonas sedimenticola]